MGECVCEAKFELWRAILWRAMMLCCRNRPDKCGPAGEGRCAAVRREDGRKPEVTG